MVAPIRVSLMLVLILLGSGCGEANRPSGNIPTAPDTADVQIRRVSALPVPDPASPDARPAGEKAFAEGLAALKAERYQQAVALFSKAIDRDGSQRGNYLNLGNARSGLGDHKGAIADYDRALSIDPNYALAFCNRGLEYGALGQFDRATEDLRRASRDPALATILQGALQGYARTRDIVIKARHDVERAEAKLRVLGDAGRRDLASLARARLELAKSRAHLADWTNQVEEKSYRLGVVEILDRMLREVSKRLDQGSATRAEKEDLELELAEAKIKLARLNCQRDVIIHELRSILRVAEGRWRRAVSFSRRFPIGKSEVKLDQIAVDEAKERLAAAIEGREIEEGHADPGRSIARLPETLVIPR